MNISVICDSDHLSYSQGRIINSYHRLCNILACSNCRNRATFAGVGRLVKFGIVLSTVFSFNCVRQVTYIPDPERDIDKWVQNFVQQRSFSYRYRLQTQSVYSEAEGDCVIGRGEHVHGSWHYEDKELSFEYVGIGDVEYSKEHGTWHESPRGEESDILTQIERILEFDAFEFMAFDKTYAYRFKANIPFLAPGRRKEMIGMIKISNRNFLPEVIWAGLPDSSSYWKIELYNYNKRKRIKAPVRVWRNYILVAAYDHIKTIKRRLELLDIDYRIKKNGDDILLSVPKYLTNEDIEMALSTTVLHVYDVAEDKESATKIAYLKDGGNGSIFLGNQLLERNDIKNARIEFDVVSRSYLELSLHEKRVFPLEIVIEVDSVMHSIVRLDTTEKINKMKLYSDMRYYNMQLLRASLLQPLPKIVLKPIVEERN